MESDFDFLQKASDGSDTSGASYSMPPLERVYPSRQYLMSAIRTGTPFLACSK